MKPVTVETTKEKFLCIITVGNNTIIADEPKVVGGTEKGFSAYDLLGSALAADKAMNIKMHADKNNWPLDVVRITVNQGRDEDRLQIEVMVELVGKLTPEQRKKLIEVSERSVIHHALMGNVQIKTHLGQ